MGLVRGIVSSVLFIEEGNRTPVAKAAGEPPMKPLDQVHPTREKTLGNRFIACPTLGVTNTTNSTTSTSANPADPGLVRQGRRRVPAAPRWCRASCCPSFGQLALLVSRRVEHLCT